MHTPKCGGSSIEQALLNHEIDLPSKIFKNYEWIDNLKKEIKYEFVLGKRLGLKSYETTREDSFSCHHFTMKDYINNFPKYQKDFFKFTFVRNPWDKAVSEWKYFSKIEPNYNKTFKESLCKKIKTWELYPWKEHNWYQWQYAEGCDFVGRFENLQEDFNIVCDKIGIPRKTLPHQNKTSHKHYTKYYDDETYESVRRRFFSDIEMFDYKFGE